MVEVAVMVVVGCCRPAASREEKERDEDEMSFLKYYVCRVI